MIQYATSPRLLRFKLLGKDAMIATLRKEKCRFDTLMFAGVSEKAGGNDAIWLWFVRKILSEGGEGGCIIFPFNYYN